VSLVIKPKGTGVVQIANLQLAPVQYAALPACGASTEGVMAYVVDASAPITAWHQTVSAGSGSNKTFVSCDGSGWRAF